MRKNLVGYNKERLVDLIALLSNETSFSYMNQVFVTSTFYSILSNYKNEMEIISNEIIEVLLNIAIARELFNCNYNLKNTKREVVSKLNRELYVQKRYKTIKSNTVEADFDIIHLCLKKVGDDNFFSAIVGLCVHYGVDITDVIGSIKNRGSVFSDANMRKTFISIKDITDGL